MKNYLLVNRALAAEKNFNFFNNLFSRVKEHSSPTVNRRSTDGQSQRQYTIGIWKYVAMMALLLTLACGNVWATDFTITLDQFRTTPISGLVKIDNSNLSVGSGSLQLSSGNQNFTVSTTNSNYKIKRIVFTSTKAVISYGGDAISESTFSPASPGTSFTLNLAASGGTAKITSMAVTLTTTTSETLEALVATALTDGVYTTGSSVVTVSTEGGGGSFSTAGQEYITMAKSKSTRSLTVATSSSYNIKFIALVFYDAIFSRTITASTGTYTAASYLWTPGATPTNSVTLTFATENSETAKIRKVIVGYESAAEKDYTVTAATSTGDNSLGTVAAGASSLDEGETTTITATPATGYQVTNWAVSGTGASIDDDGSTHSNTTTLTMGTANATVTATFGPKSYTVTLNNQSATSAGTESVTTTYNANTNLTSAITCPTKTSKVFAGYFTATNGGGVQLIDAAGNWIASAGGGSTYLDGSKNWKNDGNLTLYACWMEYCPGMDMAAEAIRLGSGEHKTWTNLTTNKILYSVAGNTTFDDSDDASNAYDGLKFKNNGDYILFLVQANSSLKLYFGYTDTKPKISINGGAESDVNVTSTKSKTPDQEVDFGTETYDRLIKLRTVTSNTVVLQKIEITAPAGCSGYSFHWGIKDEDGWEQDCFEYSGSDDVHWVNSFTIPAAEDATHFYVGKFGSFYETGGLGNNNAKSYTNPWMYMPFTTSQGNGSGTRPMVGQAEGATGKIRIADNSTWDNLFVSFLPDGYKLKFGSTEKAFAVEAGNEYRSELVEYNSSTADDAVSVGIIDSEGGYVSTDNTQEMRHLFLNTGGTGLWSADGRVNFGIYSVTSSSWVCLMTKVPGEDYLYEGWVPTTCETVIFARLNASTLSWDNRDNQTENITLASDKNLYTITGWANTDYSVSAYEKKGKFRMNADWTDKNWYVRFYPYNVLTYDANGGSGAPSDQGVPMDGDSEDWTVDVAAGSGMTAPTGYEFAGWNPDEDDADAGTKDDDYDPEDDATLSADLTLYAVWTPIEYTITLNKGEHGAANQSATVDYDATAVTSITAVTSTGYTLQGYYDGETKVLNADGTFANSTVSGYITSGKWTKASDCELTAKWTVQTYNITYYDGGGSDAITFTGYHMPSYPTTHTYDAATTLKKASKAGYVFGGWFKEYGMTNNTNLSIGATDRTANFNLYAKWMALSMVDLADGTLYKASNMVPDGLTLSGTEYYYPGVSADQRFNLVGTGNSDASSGPMGAKTMSSTTVGGTSFDEYLDFCGTASVTSYVPTSRGIQFKIAGAGKLAIYCKNPKVLYLSNGSGETQLDASETGATKIVKTVSAGTYYLYAKGDGAELYGLQLTSTYTVTYNKNNGSATGTVPSDASSPYDSGSRVVVKSPGDLALEDNIFVGWNDKSDGSGNYYSEKSNFAISENKTLYAQWRDASGTTCPDGSAKGTVFSLVMKNKTTSTDSLYYGDCKDVSSYATITNGAASFTNVGTTPSAQQKAFIRKENPGQLVLNGNDAMITLYLDCPLAVGDTIKFESSVAAQQLCFTTTPTYNNSIYTSSKYYVIPPASALDGKQTIYLWRKASTTHGVQSITIIRPKADYTITHNTPTGSGSYTIQVGDGDATSGNTTAHEDDVITLSATPGTGYSFTSWTVTGATSGDDITVTSNQFTMPAENVTVDATFTIIDYTVTLNTNSGTINAGDVTSYNYGTGATLPTNVTRDGYRFQGWYAASDFSGDRVYEIGTSEYGNKEYYAKWAQLYTITNAEPSNGTITVASSAIAGETVSISVVANTGYEFDAWSIYKTGDESTTVSPAAASSSTNFTMPAYGVTVNATFNEVTYSLSYDIGEDATGSAGTGTAAGSYAEGTTITVPAKGTLANEGYTFRGWTYGTTFYLAGQSFSMPASDVELEAVWDSNSGGCETLASGKQNAAHTAITATVGTITNNGSIEESGYVKLGSSANFQVAAKTGYTPIAAGDKLTVTVYNKSNSAQSRGFKLKSKDASTLHTSSIAATSTGTVVYTLVADDIENDGTIKIFRTDGDDRYDAILLERCGGGSSNYTVSFEDGNVTPASHTTWPDDIEGVPSGKKIVQPADPEASGYEFSGWYSDAACTSAFSFSGTITKDTTIYAKWCTVAHDITWVVNGTEYTTGDPTTSTTDCDGIETMPTAPSALTCSDSFRGWSETNIYGEAVDTPPTDLFVAAANAPTINEDKIFYAVFATKDDPDDDRTAEQMKENSFTSVFTSKAWADAGSLWTSGNDGSELTTGQGIKVTTTTSGANATTKASYMGVKEVIVTYSTLAAAGAGAIAIEVGGTAMSASADVTKTGGTTDRTITYTPASTDFLDGNVKITVTCTTNSIHIKSVQVIYSGYHNYRCICPSLTVTPNLATEGTPIFITSAASKTVRSQDSLQIVGSGLKKNATLSISSPASKFVLKSRTGGDLTTSATGTINTVGYIYYTPGGGDTSDGLDKNNSFTITDGINSETVSTALIGRHLPANFVIAAKSGDNWYALPADKANGTPDPVEIEVDSDDDPTLVTTTEANVYSWYGQTSTVINGGNGHTTRLEMHGIAPTGGSGHAPLFGSSGTGSSLGQSGTTTLGGSAGSDYWWIFTQTNTSVSATTDVKYNMTVANSNTKHVRIYSSKWGLYASGVDEIRLIPWDEAYTLTWNTNGGSDLSCTGTCTSGLLAPGTDIVAPTDPTLSNYTFDGWKTADDGTGDAAAATMPSAATTYYAAWKQTVTLNTGSQGSGSNQTPVVYLNGTSVGSFTPHTAGSSYTLQGYYTAASAGTKVLNADGTFASDNVTGYITSGKWSRTGAGPTLYAQWVATEDCHTLKYAWKVTGKFCDDASTSVTASDTVRFPANASNLYFTESGTGNTVSKGSSYNIGKTQNNYFLLTAKSGYQIKSICFYGKVQDSSVNYTTDGSSWSSLSSTNTGGDDYYSFSSINASAFGIKLTASSPKGVWIRNMVIEMCAAGGTTYSVTYNGNDETGGSEPEDDTAYSYGATVTVEAEGTLEKDNYTFAGWATKDDGTGTNYVADNTFSITANTTLYAKWTQSVTLDKNGGSTDGSATAVWNAKGLTGITHAKPAAGYKLTGYYTATSSGTKVLNSDGTFADDDVTDYITDGKWSRTDATTLYAQYEVAGALTWNLTVNSSSVALGTASKTSSFTEISTSNMTNAAAVGIAASADAKKNLTGKIGTPSSYDADKYVKVTFKVASGYEFTPSSITVKAQPVTTGKSVRLSLTDGTTTLTMASDSAVGGGKTKDVILAGDGKSFKDSVTLLIYCFGATDDYRLGTPITIEGAVSATCETMPSYTSMSYTTTTFAPDADASGSPITIVGGTNVNTYQWKYNTVNDRTSGTDCGTNSASLTPLTDAGAATDGTRYYWCEMTNSSCGITIQSPAVAITVASAKTDASVTWDSKAKYSGSETTAYYGGKNYTIKATLNSGWDGTLTADMFTAPSGIRLHDFTIDNSSNPKTITATFDVQTSFDIDENDDITFALSLPATPTYNALSSQKKVAYNECSGSGEGASYALKVRKTTTKDGNYYYWKNDEGWISVNPNSSFSSEKASSKMYDNKFDSVYNTNGQYVYIRTYRANINKVRIYADFRANDMTVSGVYKNSTYFTPGSSYAVDYSVVYNEDDEAVNMGTQAQKVVDIILDEAMDVNDILAIKFSSAKVRPLGAVMTESSAGDLTTTLAWSETVDDDSNKKAATTADASFTITASPTGSNSNTLGVVTYASDHPEYASVNATTGQVTPKAEGTAQITATLAASGCFKGATKTYTVDVSVPACDEPAGRVTVADAKTEVCAGDPAVLTFTYAEGATIQWYNDEDEISDGGDYTIEAATSTTSTLTTAKAGVYWAKAWTSCTQATAKRSNSITLTSKATEVGATREVSVWYVKNGRKTPNIALWNLDEGTHLNTVTITRVDGGSSAIGLTSSDFTEKDGVVYLSGKEPSSNATGADVDYTLTLTVENACGTTTVMSASDKTIKLVHQKNTDKHVLAFVVVGTDQGGFTEGITAAQTTDVSLYNEIAKNFDVQATNSRATDNEQRLREYYSQYDIICITDYPDTKKQKGENGKSYVDALGTLVDIRPILTMEAWVSSLANWKAKGIVGSPKNPTTRQYSMLLQCKDHEIFSGTELTKIGEGEDAMYRVKMVCDTLEDYKTLDATYGEGDHAEKSGYEYGSKPALQGFTYDASMSSLLPIGRIDDGSGNDLEVGVERQTKMEARLLVLGINSYAMERLGEDGQTIVINALKYLMKKDAEDIADCSNYFLGDAESGDKKDWFNPENWSNGTLPEKTQEVRIVSECVINGGLARAGSVKIITDGKYNHGSSDASGKLTIKESGVLLVEGKIHMATAPYYNEVVPTTSNKLGVQTWYDSGSKEYKPGALIFDNSDHLNEAEVEMHTKSHWDWVDGQRKKYWSYVAVPTEDVQVPYNFWNGYTYIFDEQRGWIRRGDWSYIHPFEGVGFSAETGGYDFFNGRLASTESLDITLTKTEEVGNGDNLIGNSWTAPIQIANFESGDFVNANATIYIFNTGSSEDAAAADPYVATAENDGAATAGQWLAIPIGVAADPDYSGLKVIPSLQAYKVVAESAGSLHLDYDRLVRGKGKGGLSYSTSQLNEPIRAPKRDASGIKGSEKMLRVRVSGTKTRTDVWLLQDNRFSYDFDNGWEADYVECDDRSAQLYAVSDIGNMAFLAQPEIDGTLLGFKPAYGCTDYTFSFRYRGDEKLYLNDLLTETSTLITNESTYTFSSEQEAVGNRFLISSQPFGIHGGATGTDGPDVDNMNDKPMKFIYNDKMYILYHGQVYDANGKLVNRK